MKKIILLLGSLFFVFTLSGCTNVYIEPDTIGMVYDEISYDGDEITVTVYITNGTDEDFDINYIDVALFLPDTDTEVCGSQFQLATVIPSNGYEEWELIFTSDYTFMTRDEINDLGYDVFDLELFFWLEE